MELPPQPTMHLTNHRVSFPLGSHLGASVLAAIFLFSAGASRSFAQTATASTATSATGSISGRVQNEATGQYLNNARITVKGTALSVLTDEFGSFRISQVPSGPATIQAFYSGLDPQEVTVNV